MIAGKSLNLAAARYIPTSDALLHAAAKKFGLLRKDQSSTFSNSTFTEDLNNLLVILFLQFL
ncbi:hypothetical protein DCC62_25365 [candidate division KSB1 bacterium]|nr:MAG: hypothetical protein DCC62_25365 [candidate division KSB1 bacterium]